MTFVFGVLEHSVRYMENPYPIFVCRRRVWYDMTLVYPLRECDLTKTINV